MQKLLTAPYGQFTLNRYPETENRTLQAWDAADEYAISYVHETTADRQKRILIVEDTFGALTCCFHKLRGTVLTDSFLSLRAIEQNLKTNSLTLEDMHIQSPLDALDGFFDLVLVKIPKQLNYLEYLLQKIHPHLHENSQVLGSGMTKQIHTSTLRLFETYIGPCKTSLAKKKARLIISQSIHSSLPTQDSHEEQRYTWQEKTLINLPNVFSRNSVDAGTAFLLENLPQHHKVQSILDPACGNGILLLAAAEQYPEAELTGIDESFMAIESAKRSFAVNNIRKNYAFHVHDSAAFKTKQHFDLILCNLPFHQNGAVIRSLALRIVAHCKTAMAENARLYIVANKSLGYQGHLKKHFDCVTVQAVNAQHMIIRCENVC